MKILIAFFAVILAPLTSHAQDVNVGALDESTNVATVTTGAEYGFVLGAGYSRVTTVGDRPLILSADLALGWAEVDLDDFRLRVGARAPLVDGRRWKVIGSLAASVRGTKNDIGRMTNVGTDVAILAGRYGRRGFVAAELGFDAALATHVTHADAYRMTVYADARDGWYGAPGGMLRAGLQGGVSFGRYDVILRSGRLMDIAGQPAMFPFYATLGFDMRW